MTHTMELPAAVSPAESWLRRHWALWAVLAAQAALTAVQLGRFAPSNDEALYLRVGHQMLALWGHGAHIPGRQPPTYFSGAPFLWPPLGAVADSLGGLVAARAVCLVLMLGVTAFIYATALLIGQRRQVAALAAAFAGLTGVASFLGSTATFEPLALLFLMAATYLGVRAAGRWPWCIAAGLVLTLANLAKYGTVAWVPVVAGVAAITAPRWRVWSGLVVGGMALAGDAVLLAIGGHAYVHGIAMTTLARKASPLTVAVAPSAVVLRAGLLVGGIFVFAAVATAIAIRRATREHCQNCWLMVALLALLTLAMVIPVADQAHLSQIWSLDRNTGFGIPFGAIAAGFGASYCIDVTVARWHWSLAGARVLWAVPLVAIIALGAVHPYQSHKSGSDKYVQLAALVEQAYRPGTFIGATGTGNQVQYYTLGHIKPGRWVSTSRGEFYGLLRKHRVSVVVLRRLQQSPGQWGKVVKLLRQQGGWTVYRTVGQGGGREVVWRYTPPHKRKAK